MTEMEDNFRQYGSHHVACGRVFGHRKTAGLNDEAMDKPPAGIKPVSHVVAGAQAYARAKGLGDTHSGIDYSHVTTHRDLLKDLAHHYDKLPLNDPAAHKHFDAMRDESNQQFHFMTHKMGIKTQVTDEDPYKDVHELRHDVEHNHQIKVLGTHATGGHPYFTNDENDRFRAVHDVFGHLSTGRDFDRHGEEAAYQAHSRMFSHHARPALASETRGQNGSLIVNGHFGPQRIALMPHHLWSPGANERLAVVVSSFDDDLPTGFAVIAHVSGNSVNILHCPFCGSGAVIGRSDGTIECGYCTTVFTVQVQPAYNGFPQSVDGQAYPWPGAPDPGDVLAPQAPPGTNLAPGMTPGDPMDPNADPAAMGGMPPAGGPPTKPDSSDPADGGDPDEDGEDAGDSGNPFAKKDDKSKGKDDKKKGGNPFAKKKSYKTASGAELPLDEFLAHIAIQTAEDPFKVATAVRRARALGEL